jgi:Flp pilus assembly protein TadB
MVTIGLLLLVVAALLLCSGAVLAWRRERHRSRRLAERLIVEGHIERLTTETLQTMRQVARDQLRGDR